MLIPEHLASTPSIVIDPEQHDPADVYKVMASIVVPRPIAFVSTVSVRGVRNLAPFSFFMPVCTNPPTLCFSSGVRPNPPAGISPVQDTLANIMATGEFVVNIVSQSIAEQMNCCAADVSPEIDEFELSGLTPLVSDLVRPPRVAESHAQMECRLLQTIEISSLPRGATMILGRVVRFHIRERLLTGFRVDPDLLDAVGRMTGNSYTRTRDRFDMVRPL